MNVEADRETKVAFSIRPPPEEWHTAGSVSHWSALQFALKKLSVHRRATVVKAIHRHLPTQAKLFEQGRVTMCSLCPRCLQDEETNAHVYCCQNEDALKQR